MITNTKGIKTLPNISSTLKFKIFIILCLIIHSLIALFACIYTIPPLVIFNIGSILVYLICGFIVNEHQSLVFYIGFMEIILHSFVSVLLVGNSFGFSMYFIALVPMAYHLLHATNAKRYLLKASILSAVSFILYASCYIVSIQNEPVYDSYGLTKVRPYIYIINMLIAFIALTMFSILFLIETECAYNSLYSKNAELGNLANHDPLTGLYNRRTMTEHITEMYAVNTEQRIPFSLIICDIDNFKQFNDTYGHECGDEVLKTIAGVLTTFTREHDFLCRWGGEEFLVILKNIDIKTAKAIAERIRHQISVTGIKYNDEFLHITMTFGVALSSEAENYKDLFKLADKRLYIGKNSGKNVVI